MPFLRYGIDLHGGAAPALVPNPGDNAAFAYAITGRHSGQTVTGQFWVPTTYDPGDNSTLYPVIYVLHGKGGSAASSVAQALPQIKTAITALQIPPCIVVMPDGTTTGGNAGWYTDWFDGAWNGETQIIRDLVPYVDFHFRTAGPAKRMIMGFSMGGWGSMRLALKFPSVFAAVSSFAAPNLDADFSPNGFTGSDSGDFITVWNSVKASQERDSPAASNPTVGTQGIAEAQASTLISLNYPIRLVKSAADTVSLGSINNFHTVINALSINHTFVDLVTTGHNMGTYFTTDAGGWATFFTNALGL